MIPFESLVTFSDSLSIATVAVSLAVSVIFSFKYLVPFSSYLTLNNINVKKLLFYNDV